MVLTKEMNEVFTVVVVTSKLNDFTVSCKPVKYCKQSDEGGAEVKNK